MTGIFDALVANHDAEPVFEEYGEFVICLHPATRSCAISPEPGWLSPELRQVVRARMAASVTGCCPSCGGISEPPAEAKTVAGPLLFTDIPLRHGEDCPYSDFILVLLRDRDCPGLEVPDLDVSDEAVAPLLARLSELAGGKPDDS